MALKVWDGFDHYKQQADFNSRSGFLQWQANVNPSFVTGRNGNGLAMQAGALRGGYIAATFGQRVASAFVGMALNVDSGTGAIFRFIDSLGGANNVQVYVLFDPSNFTINIYRGDPQNGYGTLIYTSANNVWAAGVYNFVEIWPIIDSAAGSVTVNVNGVTEAQITGTNTQYTANAHWDVMQINTPNNGNIYLDDLYYADSTVGPGAYPCDAFLGDSRVATIFTTGNDAVTWTPLANANWQEVNEVAMDSDASYNSTATPGDADTYTFAALAGTITTIYGVQVTTAQRKDDASPRTTKSIAKIGGTDYYGTVNSLPNSTYAYFTDAWILNPATSANWTVPDVDGAVYGIACVS